VKDYLNEEKEHNALKKRGLNEQPPTLVGGCSLMQIILFNLVTALWKVIF